jgi:SOS-response transcriptional repressor LexA
VAVDTRRKPRPGDVVVAWWPQEEKMVIKRYKVEGRDIVLYPVNPAHPNLVLPNEEDVYILGSVVWRGG